MKILIDNYNLSKYEYREYHQEITDLTLDDLIDLLNKIPQENEYPNNPVKIITDDFIFLKTTDDQVRVVFNITGLRDFPKLGDPFEEEKRFGHNPIEYKIKEKELRTFILKGADIKTTRRSLYRNFILNAFLPITNIILIIMLIIIGINRTKVNIGILISFSILLFLSFFTLSYEIRIAYMKPIQFRKLKYEIPILDKLKPIDISHFLLSYSQCFYFIVFNAYSSSLHIFGTHLIIFLMIGLNTGLAIPRVLYGSTLTIALYLRAKLAKQIVEQRILEKYHSEEITEKNYYLNLYSLMKSEKLIRIGVLSKLMTGITFIFTLIPILILSL